MLICFFPNNLDIYCYVGKLPEQHFSVGLFSNPGDKILFLFKFNKARILEWNTYAFSILWLTHTHGQTFCHLHTHFLFCDLHTLLQYGKAGAVTKNLLIIDVCTVHPVRAKHVDIHKNIYQNDHKINYYDYFVTYTQIMSG